MQSHRVSLRCPAKLNLGLEVLERDAQSGYHRIATVLQAINLADRLEVSVDGESAAWDLPRLELSGPFAAEVPPENNSLLAAWALLGGGQAFPPLRVSLEKQIPAQSGLGGAGSDAAGMLLALRELARLLTFDAQRGAPLPPGNPEAGLSHAGRQAALEAVAGLEDLALEAQAARIGSDAPFFLRGGCQLAGGRGELLQPIATKLRFCAVLAVPAFGSPTAAAYGALGRGTQRREPVCLPLTVRALEAGDWRLLEGSLVNDFEPLVCGQHPEYALWSEVLRENGAGAVALSGSGSGFFGLYAETPAAHRAAQRLKATAPNLRLCTVAAPLP